MDDLEKTTGEEALAIDNPQIGEGEKTEAPKKDDPQKSDERNAQRIAGYQALADKAEARAIKADIVLVQKDANVFLEAYNDDPKYADKLAKALGYANADEVLAQINRKPEVEQKVFTEDDVKRIVLESEAKKEHEKAITKAEKILAKLPEDLREEAQSRFNKISKGQMLDEETAIEFAEMATLYVNKDNLRAEILNDSLAMLGSTGVGKSKKTTDSEKHYVIRNGEPVLISNN